MPEEEAFLVFLKIMSDFGVREMFKSGFANLQLMFYQVAALCTLFNRFFDLSVDL